MRSLSRPFPVHIQTLSPNLTHHLPFQPTFSLCDLRAYPILKSIYFSFCFQFCLENNLSL